MRGWLLGTPTSLFGPAPPLAYQVTSAGELRAAHQGEGSWAQGAGI